MSKTSQPFTALYQLSLDVERLAHELRDRNAKRWIPRKEHVAELYSISGKLKLLDKNPKAKLSD